MNKPQELCTATELCTGCSSGLVPAVTLIVTGIQYRCVTNKQLHAAISARYSQLVT